jgi:NadR type nicotinamide-nucleotide adenylyltransferase
MLKKIVITGPESTGKSTLCTQLAAHYNTMWCPEYAREYLLKHGMNYHYDDLLTIAKGQLALEEEYELKVKSAVITNAKREGKELRDVASDPLLFVDTDMYVMKVWCEFVFGKCHRFILEQIVDRKYDLYLLCNIDLPWTNDDLREYPDIESRQKLYAIYKDIMINQPTPWLEIKGSHEERLTNAIKAVDTLFT